MKKSFQEIKLLLLRLSVALLTYPICKILFFFFNHSYFTDVSFGEFLKILFFGLRFDVSAVILMNVPFILLHIIPFAFTRKNWWQLILKFFFLIPNSIAILANCIDLEYYKYTLKRTTADFFSLFSLGSDVTILLLQYVKDFWYVGLIWIALTISIWWLYNKTKRSYQVENKFNSSRIISWMIFNSVLIGIFIIGFRGGLQLRPIMLITASEYVSAKNIPLILNTPFTIITTFQLEKIEEKKYFPEEELKKIFNPNHPAIQSSSHPAIQPSNIFIIILESFSKEYTTLGKRKSYTPFLDSLMNESLVFDNAFANGKRSIEGIPAVLAGIPGLMNESFITSTYCGNQFNSLASALKEKNYSTAFFHGGTNGTMGFDGFCGSAGFEKYFGRFEYNNDKDYDGEWGIRDEKFFQFTEKKVSEMKEPFLAALFSLSSHHPYTIPEEYKNKFTGGEHPILKSVQYADYSLKKFFESASKEKWFDSTLFVITADHTGPSSDIFYSNSAGSFEVPIIFYKHNSHLKEKKSTIAQQIDIMPTVLNFLNYDKSYFAFGNNLLDTTSKKFAVNFINNVYQIFQDDYLLQFDGNKTIGFYNFKTDSLLQNNLHEQTSKVLKTFEVSMEEKLKAIIQTYNSGMIHNKMTADK
ncbi:MAG: sulfatase-like hydrolase/transferase [Bacteroidetes bacterium]|nr:sulfatase-like hydrolase/transferase [Bacteroidota bacterium]